ncbi:MAG: Rpp14/Pop5 family protein [Candidatus Nanoarchaeia archaeon]|nr:Rpp14/Pop5 family protein [Candidatus Nanoarchaeia archaeon]
MALINYEILKNEKEDLDKLKISFLKKKPSDRFKRRYLLLEITPIKEAKINENNIINELKQTIKNFFGILDYSLSHFFVLKNSIKNKNNKYYLIIKISNKYIEKLKTSLFFLRKINNNDIYIQTIYTSGSLKKINTIQGE